MDQEKPTRKEAAMSSLLDYAESKPDGFNKYEAVKDLELRDLAEFSVAVNDLRDICAGSTQALICEPTGKGQAWTYKLIGTFEDSGIWMKFRQRALVSHLKTANNVAKSIAASTDGRSLDGKHARVHQRRIDNSLFEARQALEDTENALREMSNETT